MKRIAALAFAALLAGGLFEARAGGVVTYAGTVTGSYDIQILDYIAAKGGMVTEIIGNPFDAPKAEVEQAVNRILERSHAGQKFPFFSEVPEGFPSPYRVVVILNQGTAYSGQRLCRDSARLLDHEIASRPGAQGPGTVEVAAAFCAREVHLSSVGGQASGIATLSDETFRRLLAQVGRELFPPRRLDRSGSGDSFF